jgi:hypothetical protein
MEGGAERAGRAFGAVSGATAAVGAAAREDVEELSRQAGGAAGGLVEGGWRWCWWHIHVAWSVIIVMCGLN